MSFSPEEMAERRKSIGSSEIAAIVGVNPYASIHSIWLSKMGISDFEGNEATELGNALEPAILDIYAKRYGKTIRKGTRVIGPEEWMSASPDGLIEGGGIAEAKLVGLRSMWQWGPGNTDTHESDAAPLHYLAQCQWQMLITGEPFVDAAALLGTEFRTYRIHPDARTQKGLYAAAKAFWFNHVLTKIPPPVDGSEGAREMLATLYPRAQGERLRATAEMDQMAESLRDAREALAAAKEAKDLHENRLKEALGEAPGAFSDAWSIRYSNTKTGTRPFCFDHTLEKKKGR